MARPAGAGAAAADAPPFGRRISASSATSPPITVAIGRPSRYSTRAPPTRGDARPRQHGAQHVRRIGGGEADECAVERLAAHLAQRATASGSANCSPDRPAMKRPPRISPRASRRRQTRTRSRHGGSQAGLALEQAPADDAVAAQQRSRHVLDARRRALGVARPAAAGGAAADQRPAPRILDAEQRAAPAAPRARRRAASTAAPAARAGRRSCRSGRARDDELGQRVLDLGRQQARAADDLVEERRAVRAPGIRRRARRPRRRARRRRRGAGASAVQTAPRAAAAAGSASSAASRRRAACVAAGARAQPRPQRAAGGAQLVEPRGA